MVSSRTAKSSSGCKFLNKWLLRMGRPAGRREAAGSAAPGQPAPPRRGRFQFSLGSLLTAVTLGSVLSAATAGLVHPPPNASARWLIALAFALSAPLLILVIVSLLDAWRHRGESPPPDPDEDPE